jgi:Fur family transcriptional regulator, stress-responsive regulator
MIQGLHLIYHWGNTGVQTGGVFRMPLLDRLRDRDWRLTPQRRVIAEVMGGENVHLTADDVFERARERLPEVSLATVYNTLNELVSMGEVQQVDAGNGPTRYDPNTTDGHHHLVCLICGDLRDVHPSGLDTLELAASERFGYRVIGQEVVFQGYCRECAEDPSRGVELDPAGR